jgi:hypothetical protein
VKIGDDLMLLVACISVTSLLLFCIRAAMYSLRCTVRCCGVLCPGEHAKIVSVICHMYVCNT